MDTSSTPEAPALAANSTTPPSPAAPRPGYESRAWHKRSPRDVGGDGFAIPPCAGRTFDNVLATRRGSHVSPLRLARSSRGPQLLCVLDCASSIAQCVSANSLTYRDQVSKQFRLANFLH